MALFGMRLDKRQFAADFGVSIDQGLAIEMAFMRSAGAFSVDNADELVLSATGRYLLVAMMREFFVGVNNLRDQAREALSTPERELLFGDGDAQHCMANEGEPAVAAVRRIQRSPRTHPYRASCRFSMVILLRSRACETWF